MNRPDPERLQLALRRRNQIVRHLADAEPDALLERLPTLFREVARLALAAAHELEPPSEETDDERLLAEGAAARKERVA